MLEKLFLLDVGMLLHNEEIEVLNKFYREQFSK